WSANWQCFSRSPDVARARTVIRGEAMMDTPQPRDSLLPLLARLRLQGVGPASDLRQGGINVTLVEGTRQVRCVSPDQHGRQAGPQARQRPLHRVPLGCSVQRHLVVVRSPGIAVM